jgi:hypothetical protein
MRIAADYIDQNIRASARLIQISKPTKIGKSAQYRAIRKPQAANTANTAAKAVL